MEKQPLIFHFIELKNGKSLYNAEFDETAPLMPGFLPIKCKSTAAEATQYISYSAIASLVIESEMLRLYSPAYFARGGIVNIKTI